jgi:AmmeMemoRadiSam system protein B/AmmeMemoRadiSam system protein A
MQIPPFAQLGSDGGSPKIAAMQALPDQVREPAVAGAFYPDSADTLTEELNALLRGARPVSADQPVPKAVIAPHAGYIYSGPIAANAYARLAPARGRIKRVVLLGPAHRVAIEGLALPAAQGLRTPLGVVPVDLAAVAQLSDFRQVLVSAQAHAREHSLEVHLPFLQAVLGAFSVVPLVVGRASPELIADVLDRLWGGDETLIVVSSDLSHYLTYAQARTTDRDTAHAILMRRPQLNHYQACGATPVNGLLLVALRRGLKPQLFDVRNSGDTAGDHSRVVGYASIGFFEPSTAAAEATTSTPQPSEADAVPTQPTSTDLRGDVLLAIARAAIGNVFGLVHPSDETAAFLQEIGATFVTLTRQGALRGCIGTLQAHRTLLLDVKGNAKAAAFLDPRFEPLTQTQFATTLVEVSVLSPSSPLEFGSESEAVSLIRPGLDGLILEHGENRGTFLPQVWETIPEPSEFLRQLKRKAGLDEGFWSPDLRLRRYSVVKFREDEPPAILQ